MRIYYSVTEYDTGKYQIITAKYDHEIFMFDVSVIGGLFDTFDVDQVVPENVPVCADIYRTQGQKDADGENKYHVELEAEAPVLYKKEGWVKYEPV